MNIRPYQPADFATLVPMWREARHAAYPFLTVQYQYTLDDDRSFFKGVILEACNVWVAEAAGEIVGFLALNGELLDHLYVRLSHQGSGIGTALLEKAKALSPSRLHLYTFQKNERARAFYERHGFRAIHFGFSPPPENEPDVEYEWLPEQQRAP